jgi:hypothetical protein
MTLMVHPNEDLRNRVAYHYILWWLIIPILPIDESGWL